VALERGLTELLQGRALDALNGFPAPGFDREEIADPQNLEIHFVDSSGVLSWEFLRATPDFEFSECNFSGTTEQEFAWLCERIHADGHDIYIADFTHLGVYACRIIVPGMSEIYPIDDLEWDNNSAAIALRPALLNLPQLDDAGCRALLDQLDELALDDQRPVAPLIGIAVAPGSHWKDLRVGELKTLLALAAGDTDASRDGCHWLRHFEQIDPARHALYCCLDTLLNLPEPGAYDAALASLYGAETRAQAQALLNGELRLFGLPALGSDGAGSEIHQRLLAAYGKVRRAMA
jgi:ribosomal protein S12 methylthiotransferase accessory factor